MTNPCFQVKLVRTEGEVWEVVNTQDTNETPSVLTSQKQVDEYNDVLTFTLVIQFTWNHSSNVLRRVENMSHESY